MKLQAWEPFINSTCWEEAQLRKRAKEKVVIYPGKRGGEWESPQSHNCLFRFCPSLMDSKGDS